MCSAKARFDQSFFMLKWQRGQALIIQSPDGFLAVDASVHRLWRSGGSGGVVCALPIAPQ